MKKIDIFLIFICALGVIFCVFLFFRDLNMTLSRQDKEPIGTISFRYNTAQRRFIDRVLWDRLKNESFIYNGDVIRTSDLSEVTISLFLGDIIDMSSNTLLQVFADKDGARVDFSGSGVSVDSSNGGGLIIISASQRISLDGGAVVRASGGVDGTLEFTVSEGNAVLYSDDDTPPVEMAAGSGVLLSGDGQRRSEPQAVAVSPSGGARFLTQSTEGTIPVDFIWNTINYDTAEAQVRTRLQIASDRNFSRIHFEQDFTGTNYRINLPAGEWFWCLYPVTDTEKEVAYSKVTVVHSPPPFLKSPQHGEVISFRNISPAINFLWTASVQATAYTLEIANNPSMNNPSVSMQVRGVGDVISFNYSALTEGEWYWRVTPLYGRELVSSTSIAPTEVRSFRIEKGAALAAPVLQSHANDSQINIEAGRQDVVFSWRREPEAASYTIRISANSDMSSPVIEETVPGTIYRYETNTEILTPGTWYWSVTQTDTEGSVSSSDPRRFTAVREELIQRAVYPVAGYSIADNLLPNISFTWKTNLTGTRFQVSDNEQFTNLIIDEHANNETYTIRSIRNGTYFWRITGIGHGQRQDSPPRRFTVVPALPEPVLIRPESAAAARDGSIVLMEGQSSLVFNWRASQGAEYYVFRLFRGGTQTQPIIETTVNGLTYTVNMRNYADGAYSWQVQGYARETPLSTRRPGLAATQALNIFYLRPVILVNPSNRAEYTGINASRNPDTIQWSTPVVPRESELIIARDSRLRDVVFRRTNPPLSFVMPKLEAGDYYWTVKAVTQEGVDISALNTYRFRVLAIPPLAAPANRRPADRYTVTPQILLQSRSLEFGWNSVQGANGYILSIFKGTGRNREKILETPILTQTSYRIENLRALGRGEFYWQVEAVFVIEDFIEQRGVLQENRLIMDIPVPTEIDTVDVGELYAR